MTPIIPFWFKQRQCKAEPAGSDKMLKLSGPNLADAYIHIDGDDGRWTAGLRLSPDGPDVAVSDGQCLTAKLAWEAAFELYRGRVIV
jgi:hypothetical protein